MSELPGEPPLHELPVARPVVLSEVDAAYLPVARRAPRPITPLRAILEIILLIPLGYAGAILSVIGVAVLGVEDERWATAGTSVGMGAMVLLGIAIWLRLDGQRARDIGLTTRNLPQDIVIGLLATIVMYMLLMVLGVLIGLFNPDFLGQPSPAERAIRETFPDTSVRAMVLMMGFVGIWEEIAFRGFLLTRLHAVFGRWAPAVVAGSIAFGAVHIYEGLLAVVIIVFMGLILAGLFLWRRSLVPCIVMHFLHNTLMMLFLFVGSNEA
mgnify:CR=1 FL=1